MLAESLAHHWYVPLNAVAPTLKYEGMKSVYYLQSLAHLRTLATKKEITIG